MNIPMRISCYNLFKAFTFSYSLSIWLFPNSSKFQQRYSRNLSKLRRWRSQTDFFFFFFFNFSNRRTLNKLGCSENSVSFRLLKAHRKIMGVFSIDIYSCDEKFQSTYLINNNHNINDILNRWQSKEETND